jgi:ABC-type nitrate/sulfonate/bicarbonate transport system substrate-binding protein
MKPYYYVYRYDNSAPRVRHATLEAAHAEAMRLCEQHPSESFEILKCVGFARTTKAATFWMDGEEPPKSGNPFRHVKPPEYY